MSVGESAVIKIANWIVDLQKNDTMSNTVMGLEVVNEPGLGWNNIQSDIKKYHSDVVPQVQAVFSKAGLQHVLVDMNFIGPNDGGMGDWVAQQESSGTFAPSPAINIDFHNYYNWDGDENWDQLASKICGAGGASGWEQCVYANPSQPVWVGEWSDATNLDNPAYTNFSDAAVATNLATLHANQMSLYYSSPGVVGQFYWTLRMGSGWQPMATAQCPNGCQVATLRPDFLSSLALSLSLSPGVIVW